MNNDIVTIEGGRVVINGECHVCEQWPVTSIAVRVEDRPDITQACLDCVENNSHLIPLSIINYIV